MQSKVYGIGLNCGKYPTSINNKRIKEYSLWAGMLLRCTENFWEANANYKGTTCSESFKSYAFFYEWCQSQIGFKNIDANGEVWPLDKDILVKGNRCYSESSCVFIPRRINQLLVSRALFRGDSPIGVSWSERTGKFTVWCKGLKTRHYLGSFETELEAFSIYKEFKQETIRQVAEQYKSQIDPRAYKALINYEVSIDD